MEHPLMHFYFSIKIYLISTIISIAMMELVVVIRRFVKLGGGKDV